MKPTDFHSSYFSQHQNNPSNSAGAGEDPGNETPFILDVPTWSHLHFAKENSRERQFSRRTEHFWSTAPRRNEICSTSSFFFPLTRNLEVQILITDRSAFHDRNPNPTTMLSHLFPSVTASPTPQMTEGASFPAEHSRALQERTA